MIKKQKSYNYEETNLSNLILLRYFYTLKERLIVEKYNKEWVKAQIKENEQKIVDSVGNQKYNRYGLYKIMVDGKLVYIGKSRDMQYRIASHMFNIDYDSKSNKYVYLRAARELGHKISFDVLEYTEEDDTQLGKAEAAAIRKYLPILNRQLPALDGGNGWSKSPYWLLSYEDFINFLDNGE